MCNYMESVYHILDYTGMRITAHYKTSLREILKFRLNLQSTV